MHASCMIVSKGQAKDRLIVVRMRVNQHSIDSLKQSLSKGSRESVVPDIGCLNMSKKGKYE